MTDTSGAAIPNAKVCAVNDATNVHYETKTNNDGIYVEPNLPPGTYHMEITKDGFKTLMQPAVELHIEDARAANYTLQVGASSETVTVHENSYMINTEDATVSTTIDRNFVENLPLNGRSFQTLILLAPGTVPLSSANGGTFSVNGQRANANSFTVDGVSANLGGYIFSSQPGQINGATPNFTVAGTTQGMVSVDALQEFKIQTSTYAPEFGLQPGGQVSLLTRSGTNAFHGTAFDYLRNDIFDANNWFNDATIDPTTGKNLPKGKERQNDFGGTFGGPVFKDKTFFFFSYEGLRLLQPFSQIQTVPSLSLRQEAAPGYQALLNSFPLPNPNGNGSTYALSQSYPTTLDSYSIKADQALGKRSHLFARLTITPSQSTSLYNEDSTVTQKSTARVLTLGLDTSIRPNLDNELRLNYSVNVSTQSYSLIKYGGAQPFNPSLLYPAPLANGKAIAVAEFNLAEGSWFTEQGSGGKVAQRQINIIDNISHSVKTHQLKWGIEYRRLFPINSFQPVSAVYQINSDSDLIAGNLSQTQVAARLVAHPIYTNFSLYAQDTWRVSNRLSVTYGLRWELNPAPGERDGFQPFNVIGLNNPATATLAPLNSKLFNTTYNNFAPRIGLAYQLRQSPAYETVVRGGFGLFYDLNSETAALGFAGEPFINFTTLTNLPGTSNPLPFPVPSNILPILPVPAPETPPYNNGILPAVDPNLKLPYTLQWNVSVEQGLGRNQSFTASYVASAGERLLLATELFHFSPLFQSISEVGNSGFSNYQSLQLQLNRRLSRGLQALASYTYSHSIDNASNAESYFTATSSGSTLSRAQLDRGDSDFDLRHIFRGAVTYAIPTWKTNALSKAVLGAWSVDAIGLVQTGLPVDLVGGEYFPDNFQGFLKLRPNIVPGQPLYLRGAQCASTMQALGELVPGASCPGGMAFNPAAFTSFPNAFGNPTQLQGTLGRNALRGFGAWQTDFALHRQFNLTERVNIQFRAEAFNLFNHPNFGTPDNQFFDSTFGLSTSTLNNTLGGINSLYQIGGPRSIQLALKLAF